MGQRVLIGGTGYDLPAAPVLVGGTKYNLIKGRTLIGGTGYDIPFITPDNTFDGLMATMNVLGYSAKQGSSTGNAFAYADLSKDDVYYVFQFYNGYLSIEKVIVEYVDDQTAANVTTQTLKKTGSNNYKPYVISGKTQGNPVRLYAYVSEDGETAKAVYGASIFIVQFARYYPESMIDSLLSGITLTRKSGRNSSSQSSVSALYVASDRLFAASYTNIGYSSPAGTVVFGTNAANQSLLRYANSYAYISTNGTSNASVYGGSIVAVTE